MKRFKDFLNATAQDEAKEKNLTELCIALEHHTYKNIPGTRNSSRVDSQNTNTLTQRHAHVYARPNGGGKQLYSVNLDGSGHDGSSGTVIPANHAEHLRRLGFEIPVNFTLESLDFSSLSPELYEICILSDNV